MSVTKPVLAFRSNAAADGYVLESSELSGVGGLPNATATTFSVGDDAANKQYRAILSFNTGTLPDNAIITAVALKIRRQSQFGAANPFLTLGALVVDIKKGNFGSPALQATDFQVAASKNSVLSFSNTLANTWYLKALASANFPLVNKVGNTQFRLRFTNDDNNNHAANFLRFFSGNAQFASRPILFVTYIVP